MRFKDTYKFSERAIYFDEHGYYTDLVPGTKDWYEFWEEERRRCLEGYEVDGVKITGYHYNYLNYFRIDRSVEVTEGGRTYKKREFGRPDFYDSDYDFFWLCEIARKGISKEEYEKLNLGVDIHPDDLKGEKQLTVLKARRKGYSYKSQPNSQLIETPSGKVPMGDLRVGDYVLGSNGKPTLITEVHPQGSKEVFKVTLRDGRSALCSDDHLWTVKDYKGNVRTLTTRELRSVKLIKNKDKPNQYYHWYISNPDPIEYEEKELPIDPYIMGVYLGDGSATNSIFQITSNDEEIIKEVSKRLPDDLYVNKRSDIQYTVVSKVRGYNQYLRKLSSLNLRKSSLSKFIPDIYLQGSVKQRFDLLKGLMDTDGTSSKEGSARFNTSSEQLKEDMCRLLASLGIRYKVTTTNCSEWSDNTHWVISITTDKEIFNLERKQRNIRGRGYDFNKIPIISIESMGYEEEQTCITVDADDHLYLSENYVVTHNCASMLCRNYFHIRRSKNFVFAYDKKYLEGDGIYQKFLDGMAFIDEHTPFAQPRLITRPAQMLVKSGYITVEKGKEIEKGYQSIVQGISLKDNPDGARGRAGELILFEEMGKFPGLKKAWDVTHHTVKEGADSLGLMIAFGTGGTRGADFTGAEELFFNPEENDCMRINNKWDDGADGTWGGFFVPIYANLRGFIDKDGNSLIDEAIAYENRQREIKKKGSKSSNTYTQYIAETPFKPREAVMSFDMNLLPTQELIEQKNSVEVGKRWQFGTAGILYESDGQVKFRMDADAQPIYRYPHNNSDNLDGAVVVYEAPFRINGEVPNDLYILCHDPYAQDTSSDTSKMSLGAAYVIKRNNTLSPTMNECIVASYVGRPQTLDDYNRNLFLLAEYYNAKIGFENDRGDVIGYAKRFKKLHLLEEQFSFLDKKELQGRTRRPYGMNMTQRRKEDGEIYLRDWLLTPISNYDDGSQTLVLHTIVDPALLEELIRYNKKGNFDRVMALMIGMYHLKEKFNKQVEEVVRNEHEEFFDRLWN